MIYKNLFFLSLGMFALGFDAYIIAGLIPEVSADFHTSYAITGQAVTVFTLCYAISAPLLTVFLSKKNAKFSLILALVIFSLANFLSALTTDLTFFFICRALAGVGAGLFAPIALSSAAQLCDTSMRGRALGFTLGGMSCGTVIGVPVGLYLSHLFNWEFSLILVSLIGLLALIGITLKMPVIPTLTQSSLKERFNIFKNIKITNVVIVTFLTAFASLGLYTYIAPLIHSFNSHASLIPFLWFWGLGGLVGSFAIGYIIDWSKKPKHVLVWVLITLAFSYLLLLFSLEYSVTYLAMISMFLWGAMGWASMAPQQHILVGLSSNNTNTTLSLNSSLNYLGGAVGAMSGGLLLTTQNYVYLPLAAYGITIISLLLHTLLTLKNNR
ncbi:MFS transporter [Photobacterium kishitanii]|uniref:MFS transporter n=1 Tax=Photobacterium kishitanii TaxID=318456 RepID=UPI000D15D429|nr:MFS transporter [Photobacterium kishitanii]PSV25667.1 MFS transporter [Photobacterium kishitanii]